MDFAAGRAFCSRDEPRRCLRHRRGAYGESGGIGLSAARLERSRGRAVSNRSAAADRRAPRLRRTDPLLPEEIRATLLELALANRFRQLTLRGNTRGDIARCKAHGPLLALDVELLDPDRFDAMKGRAMQHAPRRRVVWNHPMHRPAIVPDDEITNMPFMLVDDFPARCVRGQ